MIGQWYYLHDGVTHGPFSEEEIKDRAARKMLSASDLLWQGASGQKDAVPAARVLDFSQFRQEGSPMPDWLADVGKGETKGPVITPVPSKDVPDWLEGWMAPEKPAFPA